MGLTGLTALKAADRRWRLSTSYIPRRSVSAQGYSSCPGSRSQSCAQKTERGPRAAGRPSSVACCRVDRAGTRRRPPSPHERASLHSRSFDRQPSAALSCGRRAGLTRCLCCRRAGVPSSSDATSRRRAAWRGGGIIHMF